MNKYNTLYMNWKWYVYIIECADKSYYVGMTWQPDNRWAQHLSMLGSRYTRKHIPEKLVYMEGYENLVEARLREKQIKGWTRIKKENLINGKWGKW